MLPEPVKQAYQWRDYSMANESKQTIEEIAKNAKNKLIRASRIYQKSLDLSDYVKMQYLISEIVGMEKITEVIRKQLQGLDRYEIDSGGFIGEEKEGRLIYVEDIDSLFKVEK